MRQMEIEGVSRRRKRIFTTIADPDAVRAPDLVNRNFKAAAPNQLWVTDLTYVRTRTGTAYVCFIVDAFSRRIVGWRVASNMRTDMVLDALEMARRSPGSTGSTRTGSTATAVTSHRPSSRPCGTMPREHGRSDRRRALARNWVAPTTRPIRPLSGWETNSPSLHQTQGGSRGRGGAALWVSVRA